MSPHIVDRVLGLIVVLLVAGGCRATPEIVWPEGARMGAEIVPCPEVDCSGPIEAAVAKLPRTVRDQIVRARIGRTVCSSDGNVLCAISTPIGLGRSLVVVLDLDSGPPMLVNVLCWVDRPLSVGRSVVPWNGLWCDST